MASLLSVEKHLNLYITKQDLQGFTTDPFSFSIPSGRTKNAGFIITSLCGL
jgi:hypothetical protein